MFILLTYTVIPLQGQLFSLCYYAMIVLLFSLFSVSIISHSYVLIILYYRPSILPASFTEEVPGAL